MFLHWRTNLADQNKEQPLKINIRDTYHTVLSVWNKPLIDTCQHCSTNGANQALRSLANAGFQNRGVCLLAFPSFPSPPSTFIFWLLFHLFQTHLRAAEGWGGGAGVAYLRREIVQPRVKNIGTSSWWINHLGSVHTKFYSDNWLMQSIIYE